MHASVMNTLVPPDEINGSGIPLVGSSASTTLMLKNACTRIAVVNPNARNRANGSLDKNAARLQAAFSSFHKSTNQLLSLVSILIP